MGRPPVIIARRRTRPYDQVGGVAQAMDGLGDELDALDARKAERDHGHALASAAAAGFMAAADKAKLDGVEPRATRNAPDAALRDRASHTGEQPIASVAGLQAALDALQAAGVLPEGGTQGQVLAKNTGASFDLIWATVTGSGGPPAWADITGRPTLFPPAAHAHGFADVTGLAAAIDARAPAAAGVPDGGLDGQVLVKVGGASYGAGWATLPAPAWSAITGRPSAFPPAVHAHAVADVAGLQGQLDARAPLAQAVPTGGGAGQVLAKLSATANDVGWTTPSTAWASITGRPATFAPSAHGHALSEVAGLAAALDGKQAAGSYAAALAAVPAGGGVGQALVKNGPGDWDLIWATITGSGGPPDWTSITGKPSAFPPATHGHGLATGEADGFMAAAQATKLAGIAAGATANATDASLRDRASHTGTQAIATIAGLATELAGKAPASAVLPGGGAVGQALVKSGAADFAAAWQLLREPDFFALSVAALVADGTFGYAAGSAIRVVAGNRIRSMDGHCYEVMGSTATTQHVTTAGGVKLRVLPEAIGVWNLRAFAPAATGALDANGNGDDSAVIQRALSAVPSVGGVLLVPPGRYYMGASATRKLNAGAASGWSLSILGFGPGNSQFVVGPGVDYAIKLDGAFNSFTSGLRIQGVGFDAATPGQGGALRLCGLARCDFELMVSDLARGVDCDTVLISRFHLRARRCAVGLRFRPTGFFKEAATDWGVSGCNENHVTGDLNDCTQWGMIAEKARGCTFDLHIERCGTEDIAGGGVANVDRGGVKIVDPEGAWRIRGSSEDCGDPEGANDGRGVFYVETTGASDSPWGPAPIWELAFEGWNFFGTVDRPTSFVRVNQAASAGYGRLVFSGGCFFDIPQYTPSAACPKLGLSAPGRNLGVVMHGVAMTNGLLEFGQTLSPDVDWHLTGMAEHLPGNPHAFTRAARAGEPLQRLKSQGLDTGESLFGSAVDGSGAAVYRHAFFGHNDAGAEVVAARIVAFQGARAAGAETGLGFDLETLNGLGAFEAEMRVRRDGIATFGRPRMGRGTINAAGFWTADARVVGPRRGGWAMPTGTRSRAAFDPATVTTQQLAQRVAALLDDLDATTGHGLIGS